jgi:hypothetical protein
MTKKVTKESGQKVAKMWDEAVGKERLPYVSQRRPLRGRDLRGCFQGGAITGYLLLCALFALLEGLLERGRRRIPLLELVR